MTEGFWDCDFLKGKENSSFLSCDSVMTSGLKPSGGLWALA